MIEKVDEFYGYYIPSGVAAIITVVVFVILLSVHIYRLFKTRTWFCVPFVIGALCTSNLLSLHLPFITTLYLTRPIAEILGFACRAYDHSHRESLATFIIQACAILLAPIFYAASVYMFLGRIIRATSLVEYSPIRLKWLTWIFVAGDFLCLNIQSGGSSFLTNPNRANLKYVGKWIILVGLGLQIAIFGLFVVVAGVWHSRVRNRPVDKVVACTWPWERYLNSLYVVSAIITIRNFYRIVEYAMGGKLYNTLSCFKSDADSLIDEGYLMANEWPTYIFDALLMAFVLVICAFWYVGNISYTQVGENGESVEMMVTRRESNSSARG